MQFDKFTINTQEAVQQAQQIAMENGQQSIECGHLLQGMFNVDENVLPFLFKKLGVNQENVKAAVRRIVNAYPKVSGGKLYLSNNANEALLSAQKISKEHGDEFVSLEHLLIALLKGK